MYRNNLSGEMAFKSFLPTPLSDIQIIHTEKIDNLIRNVEKAIYNLNTYSDGLSEKQIQQLIKQEAEYSCKLALDGLLLPFEFAINTTSELEEDTSSHSLCASSQRRITFKCPYVEKCTLSNM